jgi:hypothetical protein
MKTSLALFFAGSLLVYTVSCVQDSTWEAGKPEALFPPVFEGLRTADSRTVVLTFDKEAAFLSPPEITPSLPVEGSLPDETVITVSFGEDQVPGKEYCLSGTVADAAGNRMRFMAVFYGFNPRLPRVLINEFTTQGSSTRPDCVELVVLEGGDTAGMCVFQGTRTSFTDREILPAIEVGAGDFIVVHWKPQGIAEEIDETEDRQASGGLLSTGTAWDLWVEGASGLSGNNGVIALYASPTGDLVDCVLYSNRTRNSDTAYGGFGSRLFQEQAAEIAEAEAWAAAGAELVPEDGISPEGSTATRSICRSAEPADTNTAADWHIVPTGKASFGSVNSDEVYVPK